MIKSITKFYAGSSAVVLALVVIPILITLPWAFVALVIGWLGSMIFPFKG
jgi:hypothetical protein